MNASALSGKVAVITGASKGLGKAIALALGGAGAQLALVSRDLASLTRVAEEMCAQGMTAEPFRADVSSESDVAMLRERVHTRFGRVQILVNNAGINVRKPIEEFTLDEWQGVVGTNLTGPFLMCRAFVPQMKGQGYGRILNLTSIMSHVALAGRSAYAASKAGLLGLTKALALELAPEKITVNGISPGPFATEMNQSLMANPELSQWFLSRIPLSQWGRVDDVGGLALYLCSEAAGFITGTDVVIDGGWTAQ